jgi:putative transposase
MTHFGRTGPSNASIDWIVTLIDAQDPPKRRRKVSNHEAFTVVCSVLQTGISWRSLAELQNTKMPFTVQKRFRRWVKTGVLEAVWTKVLGEYAASRLRTDAGWFKDLFIDSTMVKNICGEDGTGRNPTDRGRQATKVSVICDSNMVPVSCCYFPANIPDVSTLVQTVAAIKCPIKRDRRYSNVLIGDKGYVSKELVRILALGKTKLLTPTKQNALYRPKLTQADKGRLKRRHKIENLFCRLDKFKRIHLRMDRKVDQYSGFVHVAMILLTASKLSTEPVVPPQNEPAFHD